MELKINIASPNGTTKQLTVADAKALHGLKIGETFKGEMIDKTGYEFTITGGSNNSGLPMRWDVEGPGQKKILITGGVGHKPKRQGQRVRKTVAGNTVGAKTSQLNVKVTKEGKTPLFEEAQQETTPTEE
ncbi:MAG: S6e family ribosomal protein [Candidatus Woesearchaeota archaeon]